MNQKLLTVLSIGALLLPLAACSSTPEAGTTPPAASESPAMSPPPSPAATPSAAPKSP